MDESFGSQYALQIALQTLRERCQQFQQRISILEEENISLRTRNDQNKDLNEASFIEVDSLKQQVTKLTEQKVQLSNNIQMISNENQRLWTRLLRLTEVNVSLGSKLNKINDTLAQHSVNLSQNPHAALIRSKTFTQEEPHIKFCHKNLTDENNKISLELEDISLKLLSSIAKEKSELEMQCSQMAELQSNEVGLINSYAFTYPINELDERVSDEVDNQLTNLKNIKLQVLQEKETLRKCLSHLKGIQDENKSNDSKTRIPTASISVQTNETVDEVEELQQLSKWGTPEYSSIQSGKNPMIVRPSDSSDNDKICPMCSRVFPSNYDFKDFQIHVENHFIVNSDINNFDVIP